MMVFLGSESEAEEEFKWNCLDVVEGVRWEGGGVRVFESFMIMIWIQSRTHIAVLHLFPKQGRSAVLRVWFLSNCLSSGKQPQWGGVGGVQACT